MKVYKHSTKEQYYFFQGNSKYDDYFILEKNKSTLQTGYFDNKSEYAQLEKELIETGFELFTIPVEIETATAELVANFELTRTYYFIEKNKEEITKSNVLTLHLENHDNLYNLSRIPDENEDGDGNIAVPTLVNFIAGYLPVGKDELAPKSVECYLSFYLNILGVMGYERTDQLALVNLQLPRNPITEETVFEEGVFKTRGGDNYFRFAFNYDLCCHRFIQYRFKDAQIVHEEITYAVYETKRNLQDTIDRFKDRKTFDAPITVEDFSRLFDKNIETSYFKKPIKVDIDLPRFPLDVPSEVLDIDNFFDNFIEENKYYFFANTENEDPMEWMVSFIVYADEKENWYHYAQPFPLRKYNAMVRGRFKEIELGYSFDKKEFIKKRKKAFKKAGLEPIAVETIYKHLSGKTVTELNEQEVMESFVIEKDDTFVIEVYENYAAVRIDTIDHLYWQFFKDAASREKWVKKRRTEDTELYESERAFILKHTSKYLEKNDKNLIDFKKPYLEHPLLGKNLKDSYYKTKFLKSTLIFQKPIQNEGDYVFESQNEVYFETKTIVIEGDVVVDGTLSFGDNDNNYIIIQGDLKATNLILVGSVMFVLVEGKIEVENITKGSHQVIAEDAKTGILLHQFKSPMDIKSIFKYDFEVSYYSDAITNKEIFRTTDYGSLVWESKKIVELLSKGEKFLVDNIENAEIDIDVYYKHHFDRRMKDWGYFYPEYAGTEQLGIHEDDEIKGRSIYPGSGDWVVNDIRGKSGTYGVSHEDYTICKVKVKKPKDFNVDYKQKPVDLLVSAEVLMERYQHISMLYMDWEHRTTVAFSDDPKISDSAYENEKGAFEDDPHLALYWLNHFGATLDRRYEDVLAIVEEKGLVEKLDLIKEPIAFFKLTDAFYNHKIKTDPDLFLKRRSYLVYWEHVYKNYDTKNLDLWWKSITIYPKVEEQLVVRMRWLRNNLNKCNYWSEFDEHIKDEDKNIPLLSYVFVCNPNTSTKDKTKYADLFVSEMYEHRNHFKSPHKIEFGQVMIWDVREFVSDKKKLSEAVEFYFNGNQASDNYKDLQEVLGVQIDNFEAVKIELDKLHAVYEDYDRFKTPTADKPKYQQKVIDILESIEPTILLEVCKNIQGGELAKRVFVYLWKSDLADKKEALISLFIYMGLAGHDVNKEIFGDLFPRLIEDEQDPNLDIAKAFFTYSRNRIHQ